MIVFGFCSLGAGKGGGTEEWSSYAVSGEFQTSFIFSFFPKDQSVCLRLLNLLSVESLCERTSVRARVPPAPDYLVRIAEPACVFFLSMGHFIATHLNSWKALTLSVGNPLYVMFAFVSFWQFKG